MNSEDWKSVHVRVEKVINPSKRCNSSILRCKLCKKGIMRKSSEQPFWSEGYRKWKCDNCSHQAYELIEKK